MKEEQPLTIVKTAEAVINRCMIKNLLLVFATFPTVNPSHTYIRI